MSALPLMFLWVLSGGPLCVPAADSLPAPAPLLPVTELTLTNGLRVLLAEDHHCPLVAVHVWYRVGSVNEPAGRYGFAHLFEHMMFRGTDRLGPTDHMDLIHGVGGECNAFTAFDETCYHQTLPAPQLELALWLESERMAFLTVDGPGFATERKVVEEELRLGRDQPYGDIADKGPPAILGQHPYGHSPIGTIRDLRQATPANAHAWWTSWYVPNNATLVVVGDMQPGRVRALAERYFGWIPSVPQAPRDIPLLAPLEAPRAITLPLENAPVPAIGLLWLTVPEGHTDALALELLATILGGGDSSRLHRRLVVEDHLAVAVRALQYGLARGGGFGAGAALPPLGGSPTRALAALRAEVERLANAGVSEPELEKARNQALSRLVLDTETVDGRALMLGRAAVVGAGVSELNTRRERLRGLKPEDLQRAARLYLEPEHAMAITVPGSSLWGQLSRLFLGRRQAEEAAPVAFAPDRLLRGRPGAVRPADLPIRPPITGGNPPVPNPPLCECYLTNGMRVLIAPNPAAGSLHAVLALPFGSWAEEKPGAASLALMLVTKSTESREERALAEELERYAIELSGSADADDSRLDLTCLPEQAERAFSLLAEIATRPAFAEAPFKTAVAQALTGLAIADRDPRLVATREFRRHLFAGHPYARRPSGESEDLSALRREDLLSFWRRVARPGGATLVISGALTPERGVELAQHSFGQWPATPAPPLPEPAAPPTVGTTRILLIDWPGAGQSQIRVGGLGPTHRDPEEPVADLVSSYFGGSFGSRLMKAVRVEKGNTYGAGGGFRANRFAGCWLVSTFTKTPSTAETVRIVLAEIRGLVDRPPTVDELSSHRRHFLGGAAARFETPRQVGAQLAHLALNGLPLDYLPRSLAAIDSAGAAQCQALARRWVDPERLLIVVLGDASRIAKELQAIAPVTVLARDTSAGPPKPNP